jgi:hypothetical protein
VASVRMFAVVGEIVTPVTLVALTVTVAEADFVVSATLVAVTVTLPAVAGAVSRPPAVIVPVEADHVMALLVTDPVTLAVNCCVAPVRMLAVVGEMVIELTEGAATVTVAVAVFVGSARLVTVIVAVPGVAAAVKTPAELIVPELADHAMDLFVTVPCTVALNCCVAPVRMLAVVGETVIEVTVGALTVIVAVADFVGSATLVALIVAVPAVAGAVKRPLAVTVPALADHVTDLFVTVPVTVAESWRVAPVRIVPVAGETETPLATGAATVTVVLADFVVSATLVALTVIVPADAGAVSKPAAVMVPPVADQVTVLLVTVPCTAALNCCVAPVRIDGFAGEMETEFTTGGAGAETVMVAMADFVASAALVAVTVAVPAVVPAVKRPFALIVPDEVFQVTALFVVVPCTVAVS